MNSKRRYEKSQLLIVRDDNRSRFTQLHDLAHEFSGNEVLVINQSATLPSSFEAIHGPSDRPIEIRLASYQGPKSTGLDNWLAVAFGAGSWRTPTEKRKCPPRLEPGQDLEFGDGLSAEVISVDPLFNQLLGIRFKSDSLERRLYQHGRPIQYAHLKQPLEVWDQQNLFSGLPISVEPPSAAFNFTWRQIFDFQKMGVEIIPILHGAGLSSTRSVELDQRLPLPE